MSVPNQLQSESLRQQIARSITRRYFFQQCRMGLGAMALHQLAALESPATAGLAAGGPLALRPSHFPARAKSVIYLFMAGGPSQFELFDFKPKLRELDGQPAPGRNEEYLLYQTLIGAWPLTEMDEAESRSFLDRIQAYMNKALKEAKQLPSSD